MTRTSYINYVNNIGYYHSKISENLALNLIKDSCEVNKIVWDLNILTMYLHILRCYEIPQEDEDGELSNTNCLSIDEMKGIAGHVNKICGTAYCVDFYIKYGE